MKRYGVMLGGGMNRVSIMLCSVWKRTVIGGSKAYVVGD